MGWRQRKKDERRRRRLYRLEGGICWICELPIPLKSHVIHLKRSTDHLIPKTQRITLSSLKQPMVGFHRLAHQYCNSRRGNNLALHEKFVKAIRRRILQLYMAHVIFAQQRREGLKCN